MSSPLEEAPLSPEALVEQAGRRAKIIAPVVASLSTGVKNAALHDLADSLLDEAEIILAANEQDVVAAERRRLPDAVVDRLTLTRARLASLAEGVREVAALTDPVGEVLRGSLRPNGLVVQEVRVPLGVIGVMYESRPNLTVDTISLCLKSGNAVLLMGGADALTSNRAVMDVVGRALARQGIPEHAVQLIDSTHPRASERFIQLSDSMDLLIPRGSAAFNLDICRRASVPTLQTGPGNCHVFVEKTAKLDMAADISFNAKVQRPGAVNSMETLLVDRDIADRFLPIVGPRMQAAGVELRGCPRTRAILPSIREATDDDYYTEYLDLILAVRVVEGQDQAIAHIARYGTHLCEAIVTEDYSAAKRFLARIDAAAVFVNASTRFTDGFEMGLGAELGISTQKTHRRGPIGLRGLTSWKWLVYGEGQVRD
jgi:glutamate-5-semialdehyde dehydrogenase